MVLQLKPGAMPAYRQCHDAQWPEVRDALRAVGLRNLSLWYDGGHNRVFYYAEYGGAEPFQQAMQRYAQMPRVQAWEERMHQYQERPAGAVGVSEQVYWVPLEEIFHQE
ncbi:hypothetical protein CDCA_CDCA17G4332 [Cyanidium caldarium]|uniref:L-rhamnose mutarotase n=1 Tax=Cyanidium caldarium TaxID=2771 RepID=A0AAV9J133_CYACA|nr:hypothetical protein CDCA_CDCA17G4332 [Cyanidium caldarium]